MERPIIQIGLEADSVYAGKRSEIVTFDSGWVPFSVYKDGAVFLSNYALVPEPAITKCIRYDDTMLPIGYRVGSNTLHINGNGMNVSLAEKIDNYGEFGYIYGTMFVLESPEGVGWVTLYNASTYSEDRALPVVPFLIDNKVYLVNYEFRYLHLLKNGKYIFLNEIVPDNTIVYSISSPLGVVTYSEISTYVGPWCLACEVIKNVNYENKDVSLTVNPSSFIFEKNSGIHNIVKGSDIFFTANIGDESITPGTRAFSIDPPDSGVIWTSFGLHVRVDTDNNSADIFTVKWVAENGLGVFTITIQIGEGDTPEPPEPPQPGSGPYGPGGISVPGGGNGTFGKDEQSDNIAQDIPLGTDFANDSSTGMYTRYLMNSTYLELLGDWVYNPNLGLALITAALGAIYTSPSEAMLSLLRFPFALTAPLVGITYRMQSLYFGHQATRIKDDHMALTSSGCQMNWGTISLNEYWGNFLDYSPHTKIDLYLPWGTGFVSIDPGQCLPGELTVVTNIEFARGSCTHIVYNDKGSVIGTYMGQPGSLVPLISSDVSSKRAGMVIGAVSAGVSALVSAGSATVPAYGNKVADEAFNSIINNRVRGAVFNSRVWSAEAVANSVKDEAAAISKSLGKGARLGANVASRSAIASLRQPANISRNGGFSDASGGTMIQYPYIILSRPQQDVPQDYGHHYGYPSNIYSKLMFTKGYTEIANIHLNGIPCTDSELSELEEILKGGVIF